MLYADADYYRNIYKGVLIQDETLKKYLNKAARQIDTLTFNRIRQVGFENLTVFQKAVIQECSCEQADFLFENEELLNSCMSDYSINGVSLKLSEGMNLMVAGGGVAVRREMYAYLEQSGLCCLSFSRW